MRARRARRDRQHLDPAGRAREPGLRRVHRGKGGLNGLTRSIAVDYAAAGIRCNTISPGYVLNDRRDADIDRRARDALRGHAPHPARRGRRRRARRGVPREPRVGVRDRHQPAARRRQQHRSRAHAWAERAMHPRACVSAISTFRLSLDDDLAFWAGTASTRSACRSRSSKRTAGTTASRSSPTRSARACASRTSSGSARSTSRDPDRWAEQQERLVRVDRRRGRGRRRLPGVHDRPRAPLAWEEAADALEPRSAPVLAAVARRGRAVRDRAHELAARRRRLRAHAARRDRPRPPARHRRVHGDQRVLGRARSRPRRSPTASTASGSCR